jgi:hypothetical protein
MVYRHLLSIMLIGPMADTMLATKAMTIDQVHHCWKPNPSNPEEVRGMSSKTVYYFTNDSTLGKLGFTLCSATHPNHDWRLHVLDTDAKRKAFEGKQHSPDLILSYLSPYIVPEQFLADANWNAFNVHPSTPDYPGRDSVHFAFYEKCTTAGATLHRMDEIVDHGEIIDVIEEEIDRTLGVMHMDETCLNLSLGLLLKNLPDLLAATVCPRGTWQWGRPARTREEFLRMCRLDPTLPEPELQRRIAAFFNPKYRSLHMDVHGYCFVYEPNGPTL